MTGPGYVDKLHWEVNSLVVRDGVYFGFGWLFHEEKKIWDLRLRVQFGDGESQIVTAGFGRYRDDVAAFFPRFTTAKHSGFFLLGSCEQEQKKFSDLFLQVTLEDGAMNELHIPQACLVSFDKENVSASSVPLRQLVMAFKRGLYLLKSLQITALLEKARRYFSKRPTSFLAKGEAIRRILDSIEPRYSVLVIDHDLGGGANHYRERMVAEKINEGATVFILSYYVGTLSYVLMVRSKQTNESFTIPGYGFVLELAEALEIKEIIYNTGVSFVHPEELPNLIIKLKSQYSLRLTFLIHDFFMVCPSHFLLDDAGVYCGIPGIDRCQACLAKNQQEYSSLFQSRNIAQWRSLWGEVIKLADEIRFFSKDSLKIFQKAYPTLDISRAVVIPHTVKYLECGTIAPSYTASLRIGVVGQIGYHKGAKIVQELADEIKNRKLDVEIVVIGTIDAQCEPTVVRETGSYQHEKLPALIKSSGVNIILFPSIWPETFSYVVQELMELDLPVACYALGAPAERLRGYAKGLILSVATASATLDNLILFHQRVYLSN